MTNPKKPRAVQIPLTQGQFAVVDEQDYAFLNQWKWQFMADKKYSGYAVRKITTGRINGKQCRKYIYMHREILSAPDGLEVDHIDRDKLNNTRGNLRLCTKSQNQGNKRKAAGTASKYKGVSWSKKETKWIAQIKIKRKSKYLGYFLDEEDAARAYNKAALEYFGEHANINEIREIPKRRGIKRTHD